MIKFLWIFLYSCLSQAHVNHSILVPFFPKPPSFIPQEGSEDYTKSTQLYSALVVKWRAQGNHCHILDSLKTRFKKVHHTILDLECHIDVPQPTQRFNYQPRFQINESHMRWMLLAFTELFEVSDGFIHAGKMETHLNLEATEHCHCTFRFTDDTSPRRKRQFNEDWEDSSPRTKKNTQASSSSDSQS